MEKLIKRHELIIAEMRRVREKEDVYIASLKVIYR